MNARKLRETLDHCRPEGYPPELRPLFDAANEWLADLERTSATLSSLFIVCSHGRRSAHPEVIECPNHDRASVLAAAFGDTQISCNVVHTEWCPGGRPATLGDLGGEKVWWCERSKELFLDPWTQEPLLPGIYPCCQSGLAASETEDFGCGFTRILIPLPQMVAGESL